MRGLPFPPGGVYLGEDVAMEGQEQERSDLCQMGGNLWVMEQKVAEMEGRQQALAAKECGVGVLFNLPCSCKTLP